METLTFVVLMLETTFIATSIVAVGGENPNPNDSKGDLEGITCRPGNSSTVLKGWEIPSDGKKLRVGVPLKRGLDQFIKVTIDSQTNTVKEASGFCIEVFELVMKSMSPSIPFEYIKDKAVAGNTSNYNDLVDENLDAVVGDITILSNRSEHVDFTLPFTESEVTLVVPVKQDGAWIFMKPLEKELWMMIAVFIVLIGTERVKSSLSTFVIIVWMLMVLVLISSYTASLASMLTVHQLQPIVTDVNDLIKNGKSVGCQQASFVAGMLMAMGFESTRIRKYRLDSTLEAYDEALRKGSEDGGVDAIMDELPYLKLFLGKYSRKYATVGPTYHTAGFGFAFRRGSPLVPNISRAILRVTESGAMIKIREKWFGDETHGQDTAAIQLNNPESLPLKRFKELFLIAGGAILLALIIFFVSFINENKAILASDMSIWEKPSALAKAFNSSRESQNPNEEGNQGVVSSPESVPEHHCPPNPENADSPEQGGLTQDAGSNTSEPRPPVHEASQQFHN
ncbi:glutamate receptor 2.9-like [Ipomoea triloba]|uniref:glutamate receptor 2.9-like n=1 Tax=Ipomoea triloba TaxID=35885 RepID=UPI00125D4C60|nr:glutamate receptor 2.9-like [Ipomoea triloba]